MARNNGRRIRIEYPQKLEKVEKAYLVYVAHPFICFAEAPKQLEGFRRISLNSSESSRPHSPLYFTTLRLEVDI